MIEVVVDGIDETKFVVFRVQSGDYVRTDVKTRYLIRLNNRFML